MLVQLDQRHDSSYIGGYVPSSPHGWDAARFGAVQRQQARLDRTLFKLLDELDRLTPADADDEEDDWRDEPERGSPPAAANDDEDARNEPEECHDAPAALIASPARSPAPSGPLSEQAAVERLVAEGRVKPINECIRTMLARGSDPGGG